MEQTNYSCMGETTAVFVRLNDEFNGSRVIAIDGVHHLKTLDREYRIEWAKHSCDKPKGCVAIEVGDVINGHKITSIRSNPFIPSSEICHTDDFDIDKTAGDYYEVSFAVVHKFWSEES